MAHDFERNTMEDVVRFFWERWKRACQIDASNREQGKPTHYWIQAEEWTSAYKATLSKSKSKQSQFDKEWQKLEAALEQWHNASPKQQNAMKNPMGVLQ